jgi:hypothetical protein
MRDRSSSFLWVLLALYALLFFGNTAMAYIGPGAGMEFIGFFMSLVAWVGAALFTVLLWPVYAILHRFRTKKPLPEVQSTALVAQDVKAKEKGPIFP